MNRPLLSSYISLTIAFSSLAIAFIMANVPWAAVIIFVICTFWGFAIWRRWRLEILSLYLMILSISIAAMAGGLRWLILICSLATLATWDLSAIFRMFSENEDIRDENELFRTHLLRLGSVLFLGLTLPVVAFAMTFELKFWQVFLLGVILLLGLSQVFSQLKRSNN